MWSKRRERHHHEQGISHRPRPGQAEIGRRPPKGGTRECFIVSFRDRTTLDDSSHTIDTIAIVESTTPQAELVKQLKEVEIRGGRAIILENRRPPLAAREVDLLNALVAFLAEMSWHTGPIQFEWTIIQAHKYDGQNPSSSTHPGNENLAMRVIIEAQERMGEGVTFDRRPHPPDLEKYASRLGEGVIEYPVPRPNSLHKIKHHYWWTWLVNNATPDRSAHIQVADGSDQPVTPDITVTECWSYREQASLDLRACPVERDELAGKVLQDVPKNKWMPPTAGLKLFHYRQDAYRLMTFHPALMAMNDSFSIPQIHKHLMSKKGGFLGRVSGAGDEFIFILKRAMNTATISAVISYNPTKNLTVGYMLSGSGQYSITAALPEFPLQFSFYPHPMLVFILVLELIALKISVNLEEVELKLSEVEGRTGYSHRFAPTSNSEAFRDLARTLGAETCRFVVIQSSIANAMMLKDFIQEQLLSNDYIPAIDTENFMEAARSLLERAKIMESTLKHMVTDAGIEGRLQAQQNVLFNLIAQEDNALNLSVARDSKELAVASKRDSSAMKVIAVLTTVFLPGAFISSFVAMPLFDWSATSSSGIITHHFWIYWATTIPLTLLTMLLVSLLMVFLSRRNEKLSKEARMAVGGSNESELAGVSSSSIRGSMTEKQSQDLQHLNIAALITQPCSILKAFPQMISTIGSKFAVLFYRILDKFVSSKRSHTSGELDDFRGIPFGSILARWKHSYVRTSLPSNNFHAVKNGPKCPQLPEPNNSEGGFNATIPFPSDVTESEFDCLNLFIVRPSRDALSQRGYDPDTPLPVFTWIHGGAFGFGACTDPMWDPSNLVWEALILGKPFIAVYLNYRLGIFGFAATSAMIEAQKSDEVKGVNFGLRDQKVGFQWIANNISAFGGDPHRVTIDGQSAGGNSTHVHALEAKINPSTPLFRKAIVQSGAVGCSGPVSLVDAEVQWDNLCKVLRVATDDKKREFEAMQKKTVPELIQASRELMWLLFPLVNDGLTLDFTVELDPVLVNLGETSSQKKLSRGGAPIEVLLGEVDNEGSLYQRQVASVTSFQSIQEQFSSSDVDPQIVRKTLDLYGITQETSLRGIKSGLYRFLSEVQFGFPIFKAYEYFTSNNHKGKNGARKTTARRYKVNIRNPFSDGPCNDLYGIAHHCVDIIYIFNAFPSEIIQADRLLKPFEATNELLRQRVQKDWIGFITSDDGQDVDQDTVVQYGEDRVTRMVKSSEDEFFTQQSIRFAFLSEHMAETRSLVNAFAGIPVC